MREDTMKRPSGSNADEWHLFLCEHLDNRATGSGDGLGFIAVQIAEAIDDRADMRTVLMAALEALEDNDVDGAERILRTALEPLKHGALRPGGPV